MHIEEYISLESILLTMPRDITKGQKHVQSMLAPKKTIPGAKDASKPTQACQKNSELSEESIDNVDIAAIHSELKSQTCPAGHSD